MPVEVGPKTLLAWKRALARRRAKGKPMPRGDKGAYTQKQKRQAERIARSYRKRGTSRRTAKSRARATVNKRSGGSMKKGGARGRRTSRTSSRKGGRSRRSNR